jgi:hypothetical protein
MKKMTRRKYTNEFKDEAVKPVTEQGYKITEATSNPEMAQIPRDCFFNIIDPPSILFF